jgi:hypothetical protein
LVNATHRRLCSGKETQYPSYRRLGGPQGRSGRLRKISPPPGFHSRTVQPVASRCTDCTIAAHMFICGPFSVDLGPIRTKVGVTNGPTQHKNDTQRIHNLGVPTSSPSASVTLADAVMQIRQSHVSDSTVRVSCSEAGGRQYSHL